MTDLAPVLLALQQATGIRVTNGQIVLHVGEGIVQKVETTAVQRVTRAERPAEKRYDIDTDRMVDKPPRTGA